METERIGITWQLSDHHGWGIFGTNLALNLIKNGPCPPQFFSEPLYINSPPDVTSTLTPFIEEFRNLDVETADFSASTVLHSLGNQFITGLINEQVRGRRNIGFIFFEDINFDAETLNRGRQWDRILAGSSWNRDVCHDAGLKDVRFVSQGVDLARFAPMPRIGVPSQRFVIFSGGKLEYRKGQDLVLAAFKIFHARHPDSMLVTTWQNPWGETVRGMAQSNHVAIPPKLDDGGNVMITNWALENGLPPTSFIDLGWVANSRMPAILREADVALFPNRCEGGTNLAAMEAMAAGTPCILSANTGHLDLIEGDNCYALQKQSPDPSGINYWCQSDIDEIVEKLEQAYGDREERKRRGDLGAAFMKTLSWEIQVGQLISEIEDLL
jgi:glycosyltransferase involved in cell wall biosynthesis